MILTLKNYKSSLPPALIKKAEKTHVRECDEIETGRFQAYVDEKTATFDVVIGLNSKGEVLEHSCDCGAGNNFCAHKTALLAFVGKDKKGVDQVKRNKKVSQLELLVNAADPEKLRTWIKEVLVKNKDLALSFVHAFSEAPAAYTPAEIRQMTLDAVRIVIKKKTKADVNEVVKIVDLWTGLHDAPVSQYIARVTDQQAFLLFAAVIKVCEEVQSSVSISSVKLDKYVKGLLQKVAAALHVLEQEEAWDQATGYFADHLYQDRFTVGISELLLLANVLEASSTARKERLIARLVAKYAQITPQERLNGDKQTFLLFGIVVDNNLFERYYDIFKPVRFSNDYNSALISLLIEYNHLALAEKYCKQQIEGNFREEYDLLYLQFLKAIYTLEQDEKKLAGVLKEMFTERYDFDEFLFIYERIGDDAERKKWRTKVLTRARQVFAENTDAMNFCFRLTDYERKYEKMAEYIHSAPYSIVATYAEKMVLTVKTTFLKELFHKQDAHHWMGTIDTPEEEEAGFFTLLGILQRYCSKTEIQMMIKAVEKSHLYYRPVAFITFIKNSLPLGGWK